MSNLEDDGSKARSLSVHMSAERMIKHGACMSDLGAGLILGHVLQC